MSELLPCPFCGAAFKVGQEPHDNHPVGGMFYIFHDYGPLGSAARRCPIEVNRHFATKPKAVAEWNTRASQAELGVRVRRALLKHLPPLSSDEEYQRTFDALLAALSGSKE